MLATFDKTLQERDKLWFIWEAKTSRGNENIRGLARLEEQLSIPLVKYKTEEPLGGKDDQNSALQSKQRYGC